LLRRRILRRETGGFVGAYDPFEASLAHVYEPARRTLTAYIGYLCRLRRAIDDAELDWGWGPNVISGELDVAGITAWAGGASYYVSIYDQVAGDTITQAVKASQPLFVAASQNGHAGMAFDGSDYLQGPYTIGGALSQPYSVFSVAQLDATVVNDNVGRFLCDGDDAVNRMIIRKLESLTPDGWNIYAGANLSGTNADANWSVWSVLFNGIASEFWRNGVSEAAGDAGAHNADGVTIGMQAVPSAWWKGYINSLIICDPALSAGDRVAMQNAINAYWAVY